MENSISYATNENEQTPSIPVNGGTLGGTGYLAKPVIVQGGTIWPGSGGLGRLTISKRHLGFVERGDG